MRMSKRTVSGLCNIVAQRVRGAPARAWEDSSGYCGVTSYLCGGETKANGTPKTLQVHSQPGCVHQRKTAFSNPVTQRIPLSIS